MKIFDDVLSTAPLRALLSEIAQCETDIASAEQRHQEIGDAIRDQDLLAAKVASNKKPVHEPPKKSVLSRILKGDLVTDDPEKVAQREQHNFYVEHEHSQIRATIESMKTSRPRPPPQSMSWK